ncbi:MAG: hypothetical protein ACLPX5_00500 [Dissulfurispiraceae bacterium]
MKQKRSFNVLKRPFVILFFALLIAGGFFFWFEYRPSMIREKCTVEAEKRADKDEFIYEIVYRHCLRKQGIEYSEQKE